MGSCHRNVQKVLDRVGGAPEQLQVFGAVIAEDNAAPQDSYDCPVCFMDGPAATFFSAACGHKVSHFLALYISDTVV